MRIDKRVLQTYRDYLGEDADAFIIDLIAAYTVDAPAQLSAMREAITNDDKVTFVRAAHTLKSNSGTLGAIHLVKLAEYLEYAGNSDKIETLTEHVQELNDELQNVLLEFNDYS